MNKHTTVITLGTGELYEDSFYLEFKEVKLKKTKRKRLFVRKPSSFDQHVVCESWPNCDMHPYGCHYSED